MTKINNQSTSYSYSSAVMPKYRREERKTRERDVLEQASAANTDIQAQSALPTGAEPAAVASPRRENKSGITWESPEVQEALRNGNMEPAIKALDGQFRRREISVDVFNAYIESSKAIAKASNPEAFAQTNLMDAPNTVRFPGGSRETVTGKTDEEFAAYKAKELAEFAVWNTEAFIDAREAGDLAAMLALIDSSTLDTASKQALSTSAETFVKVRFPKG